METTSKTVLIAEDNDNNAILMNKALADSYNLLNARSGPEALEMYRQHRPDLLLLDFKMPGMDGLEVTRQIRQTDTQTPIVVISDFAADKDHDEVLAMGCNEFIAKPVIANTLRKTIKRFI